MCIWMCLSTGKCLDWKICDPAWTPDLCLYILSELQHTQNCLACVVLMPPHFSQSLASLKQLHWLPVVYWIKFKLAYCLLHIILFLLNNQQTWLICYSSLISLGHLGHPFSNNFLFLELSSILADVPNAKQMCRWKLQDAFASL